VIAGTQDARIVATLKREEAMSIRRAIMVVAGSLAMLASAQACSGGSAGSPTAPAQSGPAIPAPRDTADQIPTGGMGG
jgi:hypothetical protein